MLAVPQTMLASAASAVPQTMSEAAVLASLAPLLRRPFGRQKQCFRPTRDTMLVVGGFEAGHACQAREGFEASRSRRVPLFAL